MGGMLRGVLAASIAPRIIPMRLLAGETMPSKRIQLGHIGVGNQGTGNLRNFLSQSDISTCVAIADPYRERRDKAGAMVKEAQGSEAKLYNDFRELLADPAVDAVVVCAPDHWHVPIGLAAIRAGKDLYLEKPLGHSLEQNKAMLEACKQSNRIFQYGTQQRCEEMLRRGVELVRNGYIGELQRVEVWAPEGNSGGSLEEIPVPEGLDYDLYIGPAPMKPCSKDRITYLGSWFCSDYALGFIAGWGAHPLDIAIWAMDADTKGPYTVEGTGMIKTPNALCNTINSYDVEIKFATGVAMHFMSTSVAKPIVSKYVEEFIGNGTTFHGTKGWISLSRGRAFASNPDWLKLHKCEGDKRVNYKNKYYKAFAETVRDRSPSIAPIQDAVRSDALSHLASMAILNKTKITWDPAAYKVTSPGNLDALQHCEIRGAWRQT